MVSEDTGGVVADAWGAFAYIAPSPYDGILVPSSEDFAARCRNAGEPPCDTPVTRRFGTAHGEGTCMGPVGMGAMALTGFTTGALLQPVFEPKASTGTKVAFGVMGGAGVAGTLGLAAMLADFSDASRGTTIGVGLGIATTAAIVGAALMATDETNPFR